MRYCSGIQRMLMKELLIDSSVIHGKLRDALLEKILPNNLFRHINVVETSWFHLRLCEGIFIFDA